MRKDIDQLLIAFMVIIFLVGCHDHEDIIVQPRGVSIQFDSTLNVHRGKLQRTGNTSLDKPAAQASGSDNIRIYP